jgi:hypothetical protein
MMAPSDTGVTMDAWHGFLDGGWNCKSFQSNAGFCFFGGLEILFFPNQILVRLAAIEPSPGDVPPWR